MRAVVAVTLGLAACASEPVDWTTKYAADALYQNKSNISVTVFRAPDSASTPIGSVLPNDGGYIQTCNDDASWCRLSYGGLGESGWVKMTPFFPATR